MEVAVAEMVRRVGTLVTALLIVGFGSLVSGTPAYALGPGQVCVFLQPKGAEIPVTGPAGHIGWGYLVAGTSTWVFGSTENPDGERDIDAPKFNGAWSATGSFQQMIDVFTFQTRFPATAKRPQPAHPYTMYKCRNTPTSSVGAANDAAAANVKAGYSGIGNNCLDATYRVLSAYGTPDLPSPGFNPMPNQWFSILSSPWWPGGLGETWLNEGSGLALDLSNANQANGTAIQQWPYNGTDAQWWVRVSSNAGGYQLFNRGSGKCVGVQGGSTAAGAAVIEWDCNGNADQRWRWQPTGAFVDGWPVFNLVNAKSAQCLGITGGSLGRGAVAVQWPCNAHLDQRWY